MLKPTAYKGLILLNTLPPLSVRASTVFVPEEKQGRVLLIYQYVFA